MQASFTHLNGYSAYYYTYMWSLVIAKDLFSRFDRSNLLAPEPARRYRTADSGAGRLGAGGAAGGGLPGPAVQLRRLADLAGGGKLSVRRQLIGRRVEEGAGLPRPRSARRAPRPARREPGRSVIIRANKHDVESLLPGRHPLGRQPVVGHQHQPDQRRHPGQQSQRQPDPHRGLAPGGELGEQLGMGEHGALEELLVGGDRVLRRLLRHDLRHHARSTAPTPPAPAGTRRRSTMVIFVISDFTK